jgi:hypothetical protein
MGSLPGVPVRGPDRRTRKETAKAAPRMPLFGVVAARTIARLMREQIRCRRVRWVFCRWGWSRGALGAALALAFLLVAGLLWAKDRTIAVYVEGADAVAVRNALLVSVPTGTTVAESDGFTSALGQQGQKIPFGKSLEGEGRDRSVARIRGALAASGLDAAIVARVIKGKNQRMVKLLFVGSGRSDAPREDEVVLGAKRSREDTAKLKGFVEPAMATLGGEAPAETAPAAKPPPLVPAAEAAAPKPPQAEKPAPPMPEPAAPAAPDSTSERPRGAIDSSLFEVELGAGAGGRHFTYNDGVSTNLRSYDVFPAPVLAGSAEIFPLAGSRGLLRDIGIMGGYSQSLFLTSSVVGGPAINTTESAYFVGLRVRIHPASDPGWILGISDSYASQAVSFGSPPAALNGQLPDVDCTGNRFAVDVRVPFGPLSLRAAVGYRLIFDAGPVAKRFTSPSVGGVDGELGAAYAVARGWEVRAIADYERYFYAFHPNVGDAYVAGGALDQFFGGRLAVAYIF